MNIQEAVKKALKDGGMIYRKSARGERAELFSTITPTNTYDTCLLNVIRIIDQRKKERRSCRHWNPTADDLIADDWEVLRDEF